MIILCIIGVLFFVFEKALSRAVWSSFVLYVNYRKSKTVANGLFCCYLTQFTSLQLFLTVDTVIILQNNDISLVFVNSNCDWAKQITWFISQNHSCCLQKQMKIELLVKRVYWVHYVAMTIYRNLEERKLAHIQSIDETYLHSVSQILWFHFKFEGTTLQFPFEQLLTKLNSVWYIIKIVGTIIFPSIWN